MRASIFPRVVRFSGSRTPAARAECVDRRSARPTEAIFIPSTTSAPIAPLIEGGLGQLELLLRAVLFHSSQPIFVVDDGRCCVDVSYGAGRLLGMSRSDLLARRVEDLLEPGSRPEMGDVWRELNERGALEGTMSFRTSVGIALPACAFAARANILPGRHLFVLRPEANVETPGGPVGSPNGFATWAKDWALFVLDANGRVAAWYDGAARLAACESADVLGQFSPFLIASDGVTSADEDEGLARSAATGRYGSFGWRRRCDGSRFWAHVLTTSIHDPEGRLLGFARLIRDFGDHRQADQNHVRDAVLLRRRSDALAGRVGIASGEFDCVIDASEAFLSIVSRSDHDLLTGKTYWPDLTPPEWWPADDRGHEEALVQGACTPFEKEYVRPDGSRVRVLETKVVLALTPFRWTLFVQDLRAPEEPATIDAEAGEPDLFPGVVGDSAAWRRILGQVQIVAPTGATVLLLGETGVGKEILARAVHKLSARRDGPFVTLNCAALPAGLLESELFGFEKGAFTGAVARKIGRFELANGGTLFLDEVGDIPMELQPKLLRALQEKEFERLGGLRTIPTDVRLIAATNRNLREMIGDNLFRSDLFYRLNVFPIVVPPLRERREDIPLLARYFMKKYAAQMHRRVETIPPATMRALLAWSWPGNVRELENVIERSVVLSQGAELRVPLEEIQGAGAAAPSGGTLEQVERAYVLQVLRETKGVISKAAARLGLPRTTLNAMMRKLSITRKEI